MTDRVSMWNRAERAVALACLSLAALACNPDPRGRCDTDADCRPGSSCSVQDHLCEPSACAPACDGGATCTAGVCLYPGQPSVQIQVANPLLSPSNNQVQVEITTESPVLLGQLVVSASALDGGPLASGMVAQASYDGGVSLTMFTGAMQGQADLVATLSYTNGNDAGTLTVNSASVPVRIDAVAPALTLSTASSPDEVDGWFPRTVDGGIVIDARIDDGPLGAGPSGGTLVITSCSSMPGCTVDAALAGAIMDGGGNYRFTFARTLGAAGSEGPLAYSVDAVDNAGNHSDQSGTVLIDDKAPQTDAQVTIDFTHATVGEDGQEWFGAGTSGVDVDVSLGATDDGVGLDPTSFLLTFNADDVDIGQSHTVAGFLPTPPDGKVHFALPTGRTSNREGPMRFTVTLADKLGHPAAPVSGQILVDDLAPTVSLASIDYSSATLRPLRAAVCAPTVTCGRGAAGAEDHALRDDLVTATFSVVDCGVGVDTGALPAIAITSGGNTSNYNLASTLVGNGPGDCANGSPNLAYDYKIQLNLAVDAPALSTGVNGDGKVLLSQVAFDYIGGEGFSPTATSAGGTILVSRVRWKALLGGQATGDAALLPLESSQAAGTARKLVVPVDGTVSPSTPDALDVFDSLGTSLDNISLTDGGTYDHATGEVAVGTTGALWIVGTPTNCGALNLSKCTNLWVAKREEQTALVAACAENGSIGSLALRDANDAGTNEQAVIGLSTAGLGIDTAGAFAWSSSGSGATTSLSCAETSSVTKGGIDATGISLAQGQVFVSSSQGFFSIALNASGAFASASTSAAFVDNSNNALLALPASPALFVSAADAGSPYFAAVDSLSSPSKESLREALASSSSANNCGGDCWLPDAPWDPVSLSNAPVTHTPIFDSTWLYTVDDDGTLQLTSLATSNNQVTALTAAPIAATSSGRGFADGAGNSAQLVSPPLLLQGSAAGSSSMQVQSNGLVTLASVAASSHAGGTPTLALSSQLQVGSFQADMRPTTPVADARGSGSVVYVIDGASGCTSGASCASTVWALQLDEAPLAASTTAWTRPGHDSCNSRQAEGTCP